MIQDVDSDVYELTRGSRESLPASIFIYALIEYWQTNFPEQNSISFEAVQYGLGSPGRVFGLTENAMYERLLELPTWAGMQFDTTAGMKSIYRKPDMKPNLITVLEAYFEQGKS